MRKPKLSVGLPVYNGGRYLERALDSLLNQDFADFELIISDNASTDRTSDICRAYAARDARIRYYRNDVNLGATANFRRVIALAEGDYFKIAAHDDECLPSMFRRCVEALDCNDKSVVLAYPQSEFINESGAVITTDARDHWDRIATSSSSRCVRLAHVLWRNFFGQPIYGVMRLETLRRTTPYGTIAPDWIKLAELAMLGKIVEVPEVLFRLRRHDANTAIVHKTWRELLAWHDPALRGRPSLLPYDVTVVLEYVRAAFCLPLPVRHKILCAATALTVPPLRGTWLGLLKISGPIRIRLQTLTGWRWLSARGTGAH